MCGCDSCKQTSINNRLFTLEKRLSRKAAQLAIKETARYLKKLEKAKKKKMAAVEDSDGSNTEREDMPEARTETKRGYQRDGENDDGKIFVEVRTPKFGRNTSRELILFCFVRRKTSHATTTCTQTPSCCRARRTATAGLCRTQP